MSSSNNPHLLPALDTMPQNLSGLTNDLSLLSSETIEIIAQDGQKRFFVHSNILAAQSKSLRRTTDSFEGADGKKIDLSEWDGDTVGRFLQFLYVGSYQAPSQNIKEGESGEDDEDEGRRDGVMTPDTVQSLADEEEWRVRGLDAGLNVLLVHAKVYALAGCKDVNALQVMALERLKEVLGEIRVDMLQGTAKGIIELFEYVYSHTSPLEPLRDLVSTFVANNFGSLMDRREMGSLLREGGDVTIEMMEKVAERLCRTENKLIEVSRELEVAKRKLMESKGSIKPTVDGGHVTVPFLGLRNLLFRSRVHGWESTQAAITETEKHWKETVVSSLEWSLSTHGLFRILVLLVTAIAVAFFIHKASWKPETIDGNSFQAVCQYYEVRSWAGSNIVTVGKKPLKDVCNEYILGSRVRRPSRIAGGTMKDICRFYEATSWAESDYSVAGRNLKEACINNYLSERPSFDGKPISEMCQYYEEKLWVGSDVYKANGKPLKEYCGDAGYTKKPPAAESVRPITLLSYIITPYFIFLIFRSLLKLRYRGLHVGG